MKNWLFIFVTAIALFGLTACSSGAPESVAKDYVKAMYEGDTKAAAQYIYLPEKNKARPGIADDMRGKLPMMIADLKRKTAKLGGVKNITAGKAKFSPQDGKRAIVPVSVTFKNSDKVDTSNIKLIKDDSNHWKIRM